MSTKNKLHHINLGVSLFTMGTTSKPRILHFDFLKGIFYICSKGLVRDAHAFNDVLNCTVLPQSYHLLIELRNIQPLSIKHLKKKQNKKFNV